MHGVSTAAAQVAQTQNTDINEVVVTARKSKEKLQDVPLAITAVTADQLQAGHDVGLEDVARLTPGFKFTAFLDSVNGNVTLRGLQQENVQNAVGNVGTFLDGIYLQRGFQVDAALGDYERIEVVKGPQSALYGQNTFAGAVNFVMKQPTDDYHLDASLTEGNGSLSEERIGVGGPIIKGLLDARLYYGQSDFDGVWKNNFPGADGDSKYFGAHRWQRYSGGLKFTPTDRLTISGFYDYSRRYEQIQPYYTIDGDSSLDRLNCGTPIATGGSLWCGNLPTNPAAFRSGTGNPPPGLIAQPQPGTTITNSVVKIAASYKITDDFSLNYTYGHTKGSSLEQASFSTDAYNPGSPVVAVQREGGVLTYSSHEVRLVYNGSFPIKGEIGYFHSDADDKEDFGLLFVPSGQPYLSQTSTPIDISGVAVPFNDFDMEYTTNSPFGRLTYSFLQDKATLSAEVRYTSTDLTDNDLLARGANPSLPLLKATYNDITPRFTAQYKFTPEEMVYASAARGAKAGGFNGYVAGSTTLLPSQQAFGEETNWTYEAGWKATLFQHKLVIDADVFYVDWDNKQEAVVPSNYNAPTVNSQSAGVAPQIYENVGNAYSYGLEATADWRPTYHWRFDGSLSLQNPRYTSGAKALPFTAVCDNIVCKSNGDVSGNEIAQVSQVSTDLSGEYHDEFKGVEYFVGLNESYRGPQYADDVNVAKIPGVWLTDGHATFERDNWKLSFWAKNIFNEKYVDASFVIPSIYQYNVNLGQLRTYGLTLSVRY